MVQGIMILGMTWSFFFGEMSGKEAAVGIGGLIVTAQGLVRILRKRESQTPSAPGLERKE